MSEPNQSPDPRAMEEWSRLESIVTRHSDLAFKTRGWLFAILTGLVIGVYSGRVHLETYQYFIMAYGLIMAFSFTEIIQRVPQANALKRIAVIESSLRGEQAYDGPRISLELSKTFDINAIIGQATKQFVLIPYLMLFVIVAILGWFAPDSDALSDQQTQTRIPATNANQVTAETPNHSTPQTVFNESQQEAK